MPTILLTNKYAPEVYSLVQSLVPEGFTLIQLNELSQEDLILKAPVADYFLASGRLRIDAKVIQAATKLKMVQRTGVGTDTIDIDALQARGISLQVNQGVNARSVAEHTIMFMLALLRRLPQIDRQVREGIWKKNETGLTCHTLEGKSIGLIGLGNIGKIIARMLQPFNVNVLYFKPNRLTKDEENQLQVSYRDLDDLLMQSDIISLHCPLTSETQNIINKKSISKMKKGAWLINTARGGLIDEKDLIDALNDDFFSGAAVDVYVTEPPNNACELYKSFKTLCTPHISGLVNESFTRLIEAGLLHIRAFNDK